MVMLQFFLLSQQWAVEVEAQTQPTRALRAVRVVEVVGLVLGLVVQEQRGRVLPVVMVLPQLRAQAVVEVLERQETPIPKVRAVTVSRLRLRALQCSALEAVEALTSLPV